MRLMQGFFILVTSLQLHNMKFKILPGCDLFDSFCEKLELGRQYSKLAQQWAEAQGATEWAEPHSAFKGGVAGLVFAKKPNGWTPIDVGIFRPRLGSTLYKEMTALPFVSAATINEIVGYTPRSVEASGGKFMRMYYPGVKVLDDCILLSFKDYVTYYKPVEGMIEILESEYHALIESSNLQTQQQ